MSRAFTAEELRSEFLASIAYAAEGWSRQSGISERDRCLGMAHSILCMIDGVSAGCPAFYLVAMSSEEDKQDAIEDESNYVENGTVINANDMLHELLPR